MIQYNMGHVTKKNEKTKKQKDLCCADTNASSILIYLVARLTEKKERMKH